ncbi:MAG: YbhB/YbcL family Raf kinase inhibitor-like protein [Ideonella sp.]|jgi:Raf kinase inhibitor-like YbhB/YbcL family protein|nr:YbhB/YbcL family Raf kinase inhibitor-like protein [Ideonella sp.]
MRLWSDNWANGEPIPERFAAGRLAADGSVGFGDNLSPHLAWSHLPEGTRSLVLMCQDFDVPGRTDDVNPTDREIPAERERVDFFHWVLVDLPPTLSSLAEGECSRGFTARGKPGPQAPHGARHGLNDYTGWFAKDVVMAGRYFGYDGPFPPVNDALVHHCVFALFALSVERLPVEGAFTGAQVRDALAERVLGSATHSGTYTLNRRLRPVRV